MFGRFFYSFNQQGSADARFESASFCAAFFAVALLLVDTVIAVSIFVCGEIPALLGIFSVFGLVCVSCLRVLLENPAVRRSKPLAVSI